MPWMPASGWPVCLSTTRIVNAGASYSHATMCGHKGSDLVWAYAAIPTRQDEQQAGAQGPVTAPAGQEWHYISSISQRPRLSRRNWMK